MNLTLRLAESGIAPDRLIRAGIRSLIRQRLRDECRNSSEALREHQQAFVASLRQSPIAVQTLAANEQHYEVPAEFYLHALGKRFKYSCCYYPSGSESLNQAEENMLALTSERAQVQDGMDILELGCGWGSLTMWMAEQLSRMRRITAVSNSRPQREYHPGTLPASRELGNVTIISADMNDFTTDLRFDRVLSVEMFEHMRNYEVLLRRIASWMKPEARLFVHIFCHRESTPMSFEDRGAGRLDGEEPSSPAGSCPPTISCTAFRTTWRSRTIGRVSGKALPADGRAVASVTWIAAEARSCRFLEGCLW